MPPGRAYDSTAGPHWRKTGTGSSLKVTPTKGVAAEGEARSKRNSLIAILTVVLLLPAITMAAEAVSDRIIRFDIPRQRADKALIEFAEQANLTFIFPVAEARKTTANAVQGEFTPKAAIALLLRGTGLQPRIVSDGALTVDAPSQSTEEGETVKTRGLVAGIIAALAGSPASANQAVEAKPTPTELNEILVTAQKREERLQDVPIAVSVLNGETLDRVTAQGITEVLNTVSGVSAQESYIGGGTQVAIRGVAGSSPILHGSSPIAYYLDGVPFGLVKTSVAPDANAYDLERVEILRGPQGTLYGASALNGVVRVLTRDADLDSFELNARTAISETDGGSTNYRGDLAINVPVVDGLFGIRAVAGFQDLSGWIERPERENVNSADISSFRLKANAEPNERFTIELLANFFRDDREAPPQARENEFHAIDADEPQTTDWETYGLTLSYEFDLFTVTSSTSYFDYYNRGVLNLEELTPFLAGFEFDNRYFGRTWAEEINLTSNLTGQWRWSLGGMYRDADDRTLQQLLGVTPTFDFNDTSNSYDFYGELTRVMLDGRFELTGGLRYFHDNVGTSENLPSNGVPGTPLIDLSSSFDEVTPRFIATWLPSDDATYYASYAEGFRSGFQQQPNVAFLAPELPPVEADSLKNYEIGSKGRRFGGRFGYELALYYMDWQDVQADQSVSIAGLPVSALINGESASGFGIDVALDFAPTENLTFGATFSRNDLTWDSDVLSGGAVLFEKGSRLSMSPRTTAGGSLEFSFPLGGSGNEGHFGMSANYISSQYLKIASGIGESDSLTTTRANFGLSAGDWDFVLYADNVLNEDGVVQQAPFFAPDWAVRLRPRTIGLQVEYRY